ncbi:hypothetical protein [uncultured Bacteroides sp.]|uniref:hypothetical protein n=1 Tax=uncultured Bacteroides sp. TaxID=162156 RepID=UPI002AAAD61D|nr:hypothetical protein [uncultured Bacteroides sp.]
MKNILKNALLLLSLTCFVACQEVNDPIDDWARIGQQVPSTIWELSSTKVKAGDSLAFKAQYYTNGEEIENMAVWYDLTEAISMTATCPIVSFNYSLSVDKSTLSREDQQIISYAHSESYWDSTKKAYVFNSKFPISNTLRPVEWKDVVDFDANKFQTLFPDTFATAFIAGLYTQLSKKEKLSDYRAVLVTAGNVTVEDFNACLDSTYNSNSASYDKFVKSEKVAVLKSKFDAIPFKDLIYKSSESKYQINYLRSYSIGATFRVFDKKKNQGVTEKFSIEII